MASSVCGTLALLTYSHATQWLPGPGSSWRGTDGGEGISPQPPPWGPNYFLAVTSSEHPWAEAVRSGLDYVNRLWCSELH